MSKVMSLTVMLLAALPTFAQEAAIGDDTPAAEASNDEAANVANASETAPVDKEFKPPPGFKTKKRGEIVLYCMKDSTVGTRFKTEKCYDETQMREYLFALEVQKRDIDRIRSTCATATVCSPQ